MEFGLGNNLDEIQCVKPGDNTGWYLGKRVYQEHRFFSYGAHNWDKEKKGPTKFTDPPKCRKNAGEGGLSRNFAGYDYEGILQDMI